MSLDKSTYIFEQFFLFSNLFNHLTMKKKTLIVLIAVVLIVITGIVIILIVDGKNPQSSEDEMRNVFDQVASQSNEAQNKNPFTGINAGWSLDVGKKKIIFSQYIDPGSQQYLEIFLKGNKIVLFQYNYDIPTISSDFSKYWYKYREFKNSRDFQIKFESFLEDLKNNGKDNDSFDPLNLSDYYPAWSWRNWQLLRNDNKSDNMYSN